MAADSPELMKAVPAIHANEGVPAALVNFAAFVQNPHSDCGNIRFTATLSDGKPLPSGMVCAQSGEFTGVPHVGTAREAPYSILIIAKNDAPVPLILYVDLHIHPSVRLAVQATSADEQSISRDPTLDEQLAEYLALIDNAPDNLAREEAVVRGDFFGHMSSFEYHDLFIRYLLHKHSPTQLHDATQHNLSAPVQEMLRAETGWLIYDNGATLTTVNPDALSTTFAREKLINTFREMMTLAHEKGWDRIGVSGADPELCIVLVEEYNVAQMEAGNNFRFHIESPYRVEWTDVPRPDMEFVAPSNSLQEGN